MFDAPPVQPPGKILLVDDDASVRHVLAQVLARAGHRVTAADSSEEALSLLAAEPFELLITDKNMPGMDGLELIRQVRARWPTIQLILMTGYSTLEAVAAAKELGVFDYLTKPFAVLEVVAICDAAVRAARRTAARLSASTTSGSPRPPAG